MMSLPFLIVSLSTALSAQLVNWQYDGKSVVKNRYRFLFVLVSRISDSGQPNFKDWLGRFILRLTNQLVCPK